jgi:hypothetical protein
MNEPISKLAQAEADALAVHASPEEKARLDLRRFNPKNPALCIYGQLTGSCFSQRTLDLVRLCAIPYSAGVTQRARVIDGFNVRHPATRDYTALEYYICQPGADIAGIVARVRGE